MTQLTFHQQQVARHESGHARVVAVAGAGKTTTLTHFIRAQLQRGVAPRRILVLMYNKTAQQDFERKLKELIAGQALPEVRTFHSLGLRIYRKLVELGELPEYHSQLLSAGELDGVVWRLLQQLADDDTRQDILSQRKKWVEPACAFIDRVKADLLGPVEVFESLQLPSECRLFVDVFDAFEQWRRDQRRISFADMIYDPVRLIHQRPDLADYFGGHMQWILVDEYQDINGIQQRLLDILHGGRGHLMVIGDPDQTIYEFRGSRPEWIVREFDQRYPDVHVYQLPETFRYGPQLSLAANFLIHHNQDREAVTGRSAPATPDTRISHHRCNAANEPARVLELIRQAMNQYSPDQIAVIARLWGLSAPIELSLLRANIPYQLDHSQSVLERWELEVFWLLFEIAAGEFEQRSHSQRRSGWLTLLTTPFPRVRRVLLESLADQLAEANQGFGAALQAAVPTELSQWQRGQLTARAEVIDNAEHLNLPARRLVNNWISVTELEQGIRDSAFSAQQVEDRIQTVRAFVRFIGDAALPADQALAYLRQLRDRARQQSNQRTPGVRLTSIHKSKGLEWPVVIIPGLNRHCYPFEAEGEFATPASDESERRLLYVAMTRSQRELHLMTPEYRRSGGRSGSQQSGAPTGREIDSRFLDEMNLPDSGAVHAAFVDEATSVELTRKPPEWLSRWLNEAAPAMVCRIKARSERSGKPLHASAAGETDAEHLEAPAVDRAERVTHSILGSGRVVGQDDDYIRILFDGEPQARTLALDAARGYLTYD